ncbi:MAG: hypothetical protein HKN46_03405 [Acidimicrobiia bacterium]|nr:hypothetical protein [Acidimicrobiia bacterium]
MSIHERSAAYRAATERFLRVATEVADHELDVTPPNGWSARQVIHHVADSEAQSYARLRRLVAEPGTEIQGYDEAGWAETPELGYRDLPVAESLSVFSAVRSASSTILDRLDDAHLELAGTHTESGAYTLSDWLRVYTQHPLEHAEQIERAVRGED